MFRDLSAYSNVVFYEFSGNPPDKTSSHDVNNSSCDCVIVSNRDHRLLCNTCGLI